MSRSSTTTKATQTAATQPQATANTQPGLPVDKIAMRAYQKWLLGGCKHGNDRKDWLEAEAEIKAEMAKGNARR